MGKITGMERKEELPPKVLQMYRAVMELIAEGEDLSAISVSTITGRAGIGKGTAYDYFDTKEEIMACALIFYMTEFSQSIRMQLLACEGFEEQINLLLDKLEEKSGKQHCFLRFVHVLTGNSEFSDLVRQKMVCPAFEQNLPLSVFGEVIEQGQRNGEIRRDLPTEYLVYAVVTRLSTYLASIVTEECFHVDSKGLRPYIFRGILEELTVQKKL